MLSLGSRIPVRVLAYLIDCVCMEVFSLGLCAEGEGRSPPPSLPLTHSVSITETDEAVSAVAAFLLLHLFSATGRDAEGSQHD